MPRRTGALQGPDVLLVETNGGGNKSRHTLTIHQRHGPRNTARRRVAACDSWHHAEVPSGGPNIENLADDQRAWLVHSETLWRKAHRIAAEHPGMDPGDVYHALRCLELPPAERLRRGLTRVRRRPHTG